MHEISVAQSVLDIAFSEMEKHASLGINKIKISIGEFSGVVKEALEFAFEVLTPDTAAAGAEIEINIVPLAAKCSRCGPVACRLSDLNFLCPTCGGPVNVTAGREMKVDYLDLE